MLFQNKEVLEILFYIVLYNHMLIYVENKAYKKIEEIIKELKEFISNLDIEVATV